MRRLGLVFAAAAVALAPGCGALPPGPPPPREPLATSIYLVGQGGHTGIVVARADVPPGMWPETEDFPQARYLEVGWGDRDFYPATDPGPFVALRAALLPTPSVLHVVGLPEAPGSVFPSSEVIEIPVSRAAVHGLVGYIDAAYARGGARKAKPLGPGLYGDSRFYPGRESFHLLRTCNVWTAGALQAAGLPVTPALTRDGLMSQASALAMD